MLETSITTLTIKRTFNAPAEKVFDAWAKIEHMKKWLFTMEHTNKVARNDVSSWWYVGNCRSP